MFNSRLGWLGLGSVAGLIVGLNLANLWPQVPVHAVATHGYENCAIATGPVDEDAEAIYFLDSVTGEVKASVLSLQTGKFNSAFSYNVNEDLGVKGGNVKNPHFLLVTGMLNLRRGAGGAAYQPSKAVVYIAEVTSGKIAAYALPWIPGKQASGAFQQGALIPLDMQQFRKAAIRPGATPAADTKINGKKPKGGAKDKER